MTQKIDINKKYRTESGLEVVLHTTEGIDKAFPIVGEIKFTDGSTVLTKWTVYGQVHGTYTKVCCLVEVKPRIKRTVWVNVYPTYYGAHLTKESAGAHAMSGRVACVKVEIDCEEGDGL
jgi:hypothetical protein